MIVCIARLQCIIENNKVCYEGNSIIRKIFYGNQQYEPVEQDQIENFFIYISENKLQLPEQFTAEELLRNLQAAKYDPKLAFQKLIDWINWRILYFPIRIDEQTEAIINSGFMYVHGRDVKFRPLIIIKPQILLQLESYPSSEELLLACTFMIEYIRNNMFIPGKIENWNILIDIENTSILKSPYKKMKVFMKAIQSQYRCAVVKIFMVNVSKSFQFITNNGLFILLQLQFNQKLNYYLQFIWKAVKKFMQKHTRQKMKITDKNTCKELLELYHPDQIEQKYGGKAPNYEKPTWPPRMPKYNNQ